MTTAGGEAALVDPFAGHGEAAVVDPVAGTAERPVVHSRRWSALDVAIVVALAVFAVLARRHVLPHDGLFGDDSWEQFGAARGSFSNIFTVGFSNPGFTAVLMVWHGLVPSAESAAWFAFVAGILGAPATYLALRSFGTARSVSLLLGAAVAAQRFNVIYSGHVKTYVIDALIVLGLTVVVPFLVRRTWGWRLGVAGCVGAIIVGFFSPFAMIAVVVAGVIVLLRPAQDLPIRAVAVGLGTAVLGAVALAVRQTYDPHRLASWWSFRYDGFPSVHGDPFQFVGSVFTHAHRVASVFAGGPAWWAMACLVLVALALISDALARGAHPAAARAQYLLLLSAVVAVAGVVRIVPFGPASDGMRVSIWLAPIFVVGAASGLERIRSRLAPGTARVALDVSAIATAAVLVLGAIAGAPSYVTSGSGSAAAFVDRELSATDVVLIEGSVFPYSVATRRPTGVVPVHVIIAFVPSINDPRFNYASYDETKGGLVLSPARNPRTNTTLARVLLGAGHVFEYDAGPGWNGSPGARKLALALRRNGFAVDERLRFGSTTYVTRWTETRSEST